MAASASVTIKLLADVKSAQAALAGVTRELKGMQGAAGGAGGTRGGILGLFSGNASRQGLSAGRTFGSGLRNGVRSAMMGGGFSSVLSSGSLMAGGLAAGLAIPALLIGQASTFADSWTEVQKVVNGADDALKTVAMTTAHNLGVDPNRVAGVFAIGGQMNIPQDELKAYTETMLKAGMATNMTAEGAADMAGQFSNAMREVAPDKWNKILSTVDALADVIPGGESDLMELAQRFALAGKSAGLSSADVLGYSSFVKGVGVDPEMGGSALSRMFIGLAETGSAARGQAAPDPMTIRDAQDKAGDLTGDLALAEERRKEMFSSKTGRLLKQYRKHPAELQAADMNIARLKREQQYAKEAMEEATHPGQKMAKMWAAMAGMSVEDYGAGVKADPSGTMLRVLEGLRAENAQGNLFPALGKLGISDIREIQTIAPMVENLDTPETGLRALLALSGSSWANPTKLDTDVTRVMTSDTFAGRQAKADAQIQAITSGTPILHQESQDVTAFMKLIQDFGGNPLGAMTTFFQSIGDVEKVVGGLVAVGLGLKALQIVPAAGSLLSWIMKLGGGGAAPTTGIAPPVPPTLPGTTPAFGTDALVKGGLFGKVGVIATALGLADAAVDLVDMGAQVVRNPNEIAEPHHLVTNALIDKLTGGGGVTINVQTLATDAGAIKDAVLAALTQAAQQASAPSNAPVTPALGGARY